MKGFVFLISITLVVMEFSMAAPTPVRAAFDQRYSKAIELETSKELKKAVAEYEKLYRDGFATNAFLERYQRALYKIGQYESSQQIGQMLLGRQPNSVSALFATALAESQLKNYGSSLDLLNRAAVQEPKKAEIHEALLFVADKMGRQDLKLGAYRKLMWIDPSNVNHARDYLRTLNVVREKEKTDPESFLKEVQRLHLEFSDDSVVNHFMSVGYRATGREDLATHYEQQSQSMRR